MTHEFKNKIKRYVLASTFVFYSLSAFSQQPDTLINKLDSLQKATDTTGKQINNTDPSAFNENTVITFPAYFILLGSDMKQAFLTPFRLQKRDLGNVAKFALLEVGLSFADKPIQRNALDLRNNNRTVRGISNYVTQFGGLYEVYTLLALGTYGFILKSQKLKTTTLLATQSYLTAGAVSTVVKFLSGRQRPNFYDGTGAGASPQFRGPFYKLENAAGYKTNSSFPSGHTTGAFAAATVFALEYKKTPWIPVLSYSVATLIGLSRITENKHWLTDIVAGAALGFLTGQQVVNNYHRYARIRNGETNKLTKLPTKKNTLSFNLNYSSGQVISGLIYKIN